MRLCEEIYIFISTKPHDLEITYNSIWITIGFWISAFSVVEYYQSHFSSSRVNIFILLNTLIGELKMKFAILEFISRHTFPWTMDIKIALNFIEKFYFSIQIQFRECSTLPEWRKYHFRWIQDTLLNFHVSWTRNNQPRSGNMEFITWFQINTITIILVENTSIFRTQVEPFRRITRTDHFQ